MEDNEPGELGMPNAAQDKRGGSRLHLASETKGIAIMFRVHEKTTTTVIANVSGILGTGSIAVTRVVHTMIGVSEVDLDPRIDGRDGRVGRGLPGSRIGGTSIASATEIEKGRGIIVGSLS